MDVNDILCENGKQLGILNNNWFGFVLARLFKMITIRMCDRSSIFLICRIYDSSLRWINCLNWLLFEGVDFHLHFVHIRFY